MGDYDRMSRAGLIETIHSLETRLASAASSASSPPGSSATFPVFGEREQREFDASPHAIRIFDRETTKYLEVNDAAVKLYGYTRDEFLTLTTRNTRHPEERSESSTTLADPTGYLRHRGPRRHVGKSGEVIVVEVVQQDILFNGRAARLLLTLDVTERVRAEALLQQREQEFESLAKNLPEVVVRFDREIRHIYVNTALERVTGLPREAFLGKTHSEIALPRDLAARFDESLREVFATGRPNYLEFTLTTADGERHFESRHIPEPDSDGVVRTALCVAHDVTVRKRAQAELEMRQRILDAIIDNIPIGVSLKDADTLRFGVRNLASARLTGIGSRESVGNTVHDLFPKEVADEITDADRAMLRAGSIVEVPEHVLAYSPQLNDRVLRVRKVPVRGADGAIAHVLSVVEDVTEYKRVEAELRRSEQRLSQLISLSPAAIFSFSLEPPYGATFISANVTAQTGWLPSDFTGDPSFWFDHIDPQDQALAGKAVSRIAIDGKYVCEYRFLHKDGSWRWMRDEGQVVRAADGRPCEGIGIWMDITEERWEEEERLRRALRQRDALVREVHHRIKNNLQGVVGLLRQLAIEHPDMRPLMDKAVAQLQAVAVVHGLQGRVAHRGVLLQEIVPAIAKAIEEMTRVPLRVEIAADTTAPLLLPENEAVPIALVLNEVMLNAAKCAAAQPEPDTVRVTLSLTAETARVTVSNPGRLPPRFDFALSRGVGTGLRLVKSLLPQEGVRLDYSHAGGRVQTVVELCGPALTSEVEALAVEAWRVWGQVLPFCC